MHIKSLKVFCDVVSQRSFSRAADDNGISQSGASQIVHQLEDHLAVKLLDRSKRPFVLTREGEIYYDGCRKIVQRYSALEEEVRTLHEEVTFDRSRVTSVDWASYPILKFPEAPQVDVILIEVPDEVGGYGAKGVGEIGCVATAGAVAGARNSFTHGLAAEATARMPPHQPVPIMPTLILGFVICVPAIGIGERQRNDRAPL